MLDVIGPAGEALPLPALPVEAVAAQEGRNLGKLIQVIEIQKGVEKGVAEGVGFRGIAVMAYVTLIEGAGWGLGVGFIGHGDFAND